MEFDNGSIKDRQSWSNGVQEAPNPALMKPLQPSTELAAVVGSSPLPRTEVVSKVWDYIKANNRQNPQNKREILPDAKPQTIFGELR